MLPLLPPGVPRLLYAHNLERDLFAAQLDDLPAPLSWVRSRLGRDLDKLRACELGGMRACERVLFISAADQAQARTEAGSLRTLHLPPLFDYEPPARARRTQLRGTPRLGFLANFTWWPNRTAARWLLQEVLPRVTRDLRLHLFGDGSRNIARSDPRVIAHGFVDDVTEVFASCDVMLCPTVSGAGVNVKFAEALYNGVPVLATPRAARGLPLPIDAGIVLADGAEEWARLLSGEGLERLAARQLAPAAARPFAPATHAAAVHQFLRAAVAGEEDTVRVAPESECAPSH
jgi:glycosyltransferase involved in cell wall biosynthesis